MIEARAAVRNAQNTVRWLQRFHAKSLAAENTAVRVEAYRLMRLLRKEIRAGAPGGKRFAPLSTLARRDSGPRRMRPDRPLAALSRRIGYEVTNRTPIEMKIGFVGPPSSDTWRKLAKIHQEGFSFGEGSRQGTRNTGMPQRRRAYFARGGGKLSKGAKGRRHMFIRKSTRRFEAPARPIIDPFYRRHRAEALRNIVINTRRKIRGERI